ncbi:hypothetical protein ANN_27225 [Periplaneta americana]|uniref:Reverse transcriptase domain-containing protein n=1 Tax=Periplaneta americana TaxID=6978 RepID=A0ABQ8RXG6_PERAM|nr:hypothetical protein ANN_27225 [Periplaneta americana]
MHHTLRNYKPIPLLSRMAKTLERMVNKRFNWFLENLGILSNEAGFRRNRSTRQQVTKLNQHIMAALDKSKVLTAVSVDFSSANDSVWKENLILKLYKVGVTSNMLKWFESFIGERYCKVKYGHSYSHCKILRTGVPQGAVLSCTLFNIYVNDLIADLTSVNEIKCLMYADDLVLWSEASKYRATKNTENVLNKGIRQTRKLVL